jgi:hypothetical protein
MRVRVLLGVLTTMSFFDCGGNVSANGTNAPVLAQGGNTIDAGESTAVGGTPAAGSTEPAGTGGFVSATGGTPNTTAAQTGGTASGGVAATGGTQTVSTLDSGIDAATDSGTNPAGCPESLTMESSGQPVCDQSWNTGLRCQYTLSLPDSITCTFIQSCPQGIFLETYWHCWPQPPCPSEPPSDGAPCEPEGQSCPYSNNYTPYADCHSCTTECTGWFNCFGICCSAVGACFFDWLCKSGQWQRSENSGCLD